MAQEACHAHKKLWQNVKNQQNCCLLHNNFLHTSTNNAFDFILENNITERRRSCHDNDQDKDNYDKKGARACDRPCLYIMNFVLLIVYYFMIIIMYYYHLMMIKGARACRPALLSLLLLLGLLSQWR